MSPNDPFRVVRILEFPEGKSEFLDRIEPPDPEEVFLDRAHEPFTGHQRQRRIHGPCIDREVLQTRKAPELVAPGLFVRNCVYRLGNAEQNQ